MTAGQHDCLTFAADDRAAAELGLGAAALRYAAMGYAVLPLARRAKKPHPMLGETGGVWHASKEPVKIINWWSSDPAAGVGIACGQASQLMVIDLDVKHGVDGRGEFMRFINRYQLDLPTGFPVAVTPSGGQHLYFRTPAGWPVGQRNGIIEAVDIKGDGGYVVAAPTMIMTPTLDRPGEPGADVLLPYSWASGCPCSLPWAPEWLFSWIASAPPATVGDGSAGPAVDLDQLQENGLPEGLRNSGLYWYTCSLYARLWADPEVEEKVTERIEQVLKRTSRKDFGPREVTTIRASARAFVERSREKALAAWEGRWKLLDR